MFTKRHYKAIVAIVKNGHEEDNWNSGRWDASRIIAEQLSDYFEKDNPDFKREYFMFACGLTEEKINKFYT